MSTRTVVLLLVVSYLALPTFTFSFCLSSTPFRISTTKTFTDLDRYHIPSVPTTMPRIPFSSSLRSLSLTSRTKKLSSSSLLMSSITQHATKHFKRASTSTISSATSVNSAITTTSTTLHSKAESAQHGEQLINPTSTSTTESLVKSIIHKKKHKISFAIAGGGSQAISSLASTPGASSVLLTGSVLYDRSSFCQYLSQYPPMSNAIADNDTGTSMSYKNHLHQFGFASSGAAILASQASLQHSFTLSPSISLGEMMNKNMGVGCTSTLVSHGREHRSSRIHIALCKGDGSGVLCNIRLSCDGLEKSDVNSSSSTSSVDRADSSTTTSTTATSRSSSISVNSNTNRRSRQEEDQLMARLILSCIDNLGDELGGGENKDSDTDWCRDMLHQNGDTIEISSFHTLPLSSGGKTPLVMVAERITDPKDDVTDAVVIAPREKHDGDVDMVPLAHTVITSDPIILPGSFNPPHIGHVSLAQAAVRTVTKKKRDELEEYFDASTKTCVNDSSTTSSSMKSSSTMENGNDSSSSVMIEDLWNTSEYQSFKSIIDHHDDNDLGPFTVLFEMSLTNADKPPMEASEAERRVKLFGTMATNDSDSDDATPSMEMPKDWGVLLTNAPLFIDKVKLIKNHLAPSLATYECGESSTHIIPSRRQITFVIGTDTMVRIINPKYYGNSEENMLAAVRDMGEEGVHFVVGGRVEQIKGIGGEGKTRFITGEEELESLPEDVQKIFTIIKEEDFRVDVSSTELR